MRPVTTARRWSGAAVEGLLILGILAVLAFGASLLVRGTPGDAPSALAGRNSGVLVVPNGVFAGTTTATANPGDDGTWVMAECFQNGTVVYRQYVRVDPATHTAVLTLGPTPLWTSGAASCAAEEGWWQRGTRWRVLATTTFEVSG